MPPQPCIVLSTQFITEFNGIWRQLPPHGTTHPASCFLPQLGWHLFCKLSHGSFMSCLPELFYTPDILFCDWPAHREDKGPIPAVSWGPSLSVQVVEGYFSSGRTRVLASIWCGCMTHSSWLLSVELWFIISPLHFHSQSCWASNSLTAPNTKRFLSNSLLQIRNINMTALSHPAVIVFHMILPVP